MAAIQQLSRSQDFGRRRVYPVPRAACLLAAVTLLRPEVLVEPNRPGCM